MEDRLQRHGPAADVEPEVRRIRLTVDNNASNRSLVAPSRGKDSANSLQPPQVGIAEGVFAADPGFARILRIKGSELAMGGDIANRFGIDQCCYEAQRLVGADVAHAADLEGGAAPVDVGVVALRVRPDRRGVVAGSN